MLNRQALLMLDDGTCFTGVACGTCGEAAGEVVFTTAMAGYQETLTDPSYYGQIVVFTSAHIGNYGITPLDDESGRIWANGAVFHDFCAPGRQGEPAAPFPHWRASESLDERLIRAGVTSIRGVDTRALTLHLREYGARNGVISALDTDKASLLRRARALPPMQGLDLTGQVSCAKPYVFSDAPAAPLPAAPAGLRVAVIDYGLKRSILSHLVRRGMSPRVWPSTAAVEDILASKPDGVLLSNGPGDPEPCRHAAATVRKLLGRVPLFGICLGHQLLGLALGAKTYKLPFGHHGVNHPVKDLLTGRVCITSQNHGFCVDPQTLPQAVAPSHLNLNDDTLEGLVCGDFPAFSVQFHPEAAPGPVDAVDLFSRFRDMMTEKGGARGDRA
ncbi:MAG: glutamine-hydrolyzing carbamoyl-phosphate synthase small subunit [Desulfovibrio sp.]|jgi:carbamoyl-phosphate synthase small subunit|nr:glutamine-hydrolyzing carbamoyl-phosphate synthase small subunit [Desulfovibrio sp.]